MPNPNSALHDVMAEVTSTSQLSCRDAFIPRLDTLLEICEEEASNESSILYILLEGVEEQNEFSLNTSESDNTGEICGASYKDAFVSLGLDK